MRKAAVSESRIDLPNIDTALFQQPDAQRLMAPERATHAPRFLLLYGSLRERSFSRLAAEEAAHILSALGGETRMFRSEEHTSELQSLMRNSYAAYCLEKNTTVHT